MKLSLKILALAVVAAFACSVIGCSAPQGYSYSNVSISLQAGCTDCPAGVTFNPTNPVPTSGNGTQATSSAIPSGAIITMPPGGGEGGTLTVYATVTNAPSNNVTWTLYPTPNLSSISNLPTSTSLPVGESGDPVGTIETASGSTIYYNAPGVPVYSGAALVQAQALGIPQGDVLLVASVPNDPANPSSVASTSQLIQVYNQGSNPQGPPSTYMTPHTGSSPSGQTQPEVTVARGTSYAFYGGAVGAAPCLSATACGSTPLYTADNTVLWAVGPAPVSLATAVIGGNSTWGTISTSGVYTAPAAIPATCSSGCTSINGEVVVYVISHLVQTVYSYAYIGIN